MSITGITQNVHSPQFNSSRVCRRHENRAAPQSEEPGGAPQYQDESGNVEVPAGDIFNILDIMEKMIAIMLQLVRRLSGRWATRGRQAPRPPKEKGGPKRPPNCSPPAGPGFRPRTGPPAAPGGDGVEFGVNARPTWKNSSYQKLTPDQQMQKVNALGLSTYAFDLNSGNAAQCYEIIDAANRHGIKIQANLGVDRNRFKGFQDAYAAAKKEGAKSGKLFGTQVASFQLDNELDSWVYENGATPDPQRLAIAEGIVKGLHDGLRTSAPNVDTIVNTTQAPSGIALLKQFRRDGLDWSITGLHWYSPDGDNITTAGGTGTTLGNLHKLGKPIAITEFNGSPNSGKGPTANRRSNAKILSRQMRAIVDSARKYDIISANLHELMNEPELGDYEGNYGILDSNGNLTASSLAVANFTSKYAKPQNK